jgi:hypothetical protein
MKIFPPLTEMLWPPGQDLTDVIRAQRYALLVVACIVAAWTAWPSTGEDTADSNNAIRSPNVASLTVAASPSKPSCSALIARHATSPASEQACTEANLAPGQSIITNAALERGPMPPRSHALTASDLAIVAPSQLRKSVFDETGSPIYVIEQPALAWSPNPN